MKRGSIHGAFQPRPSPDRALAGCFRLIAPSGKGPHPRRTMGPMSAGCLGQTSFYRPSIMARALRRRRTTSSIGTAPVHRLARARPRAARPQLDIATAPPRAAAASVPASERTHVRTRPFWTASRNSVRFFFISPSVAAAICWESFCVSSCLSWFVRIG